MDDKSVLKTIKEFHGLITVDEGKLLFSLTKNLKKNESIVEIGSFEGGSTVILSKSKNKVYAIDPHIHGTLENFKKNTSKIKNIIPIIEKSHEAVKKWNKPIHLLWIDGDHSYKFAKMDFLLWEPFLTLGGIIAVHDTEDTESIMPTTGLINKKHNGASRMAKKYIINSKRFKSFKRVDSITFARKIKVSDNMEKLAIKLNLFFIHFSLVYDIYWRILEIIDGFLGKLGIFLRKSFLGHNFKFKRNKL